MERNKYSYLIEKFAQAAGSLATGSGAIKERLLGACVGLSGFSTDNFPEHLQEYWQSIESLIRSKEHVTNSEGEVVIGVFENSIDHMSESDCISVASQIYDLKTQLEDL